MTKTSKTRRNADDAPLTIKEMKTARPFRKADPALVAAIRKSRGRPTGRRKESVHLSLDKDLITVLRASGKGWQTRANDKLRKAFKLPPVKPADYHAH